jgi:hypothetical protein
VSVPSENDVATNRREYPRLQASYKVRYGVCGAPGRQIPGFTEDMGIGGLRFVTPESDALPGDHLALEVLVPGYESPLYFLAEVVRTSEMAAGVEVAVRFDYLGKSEDYKSMLTDFLAEHGAE